MPPSVCKFCPHCIKCFLSYTYKQHLQASKSRDMGLLTSDFSFKRSASSQSNCCPWPFSEQVSAVALMPLCGVTNGRAQSRKYQNDIYSCTRVEVSLLLLFSLNSKLRGSVMCQDSNYKKTVSSDFKETLYVTKFNTIWGILLTRQLIWVPSSSKCGWNIQI